MEKDDFTYAQKIWDYMRFEQPLKKADIIIGLGSTDIRTAEWCARLYKKELAPNILFTGARGKITRDAFTENEADVYTKRAIELGVPESTIIKETKATNTGENIKFSHTRLQELGINVASLIVVTKPYMLRRAYATFMKQWPINPKPSVICSAVNISFEDYCKNDMYPFEYVTNVMVGDLQRIKEYGKLGYQIEQSIPEDVWEAWEILVKKGFTKHLLK